MKNAVSYLLVLILLFASCKKGTSDLSNNVADKENLDGNGLPIMTFDVKLPVVANNSSYTIDLIQWDIPSDYTNATKTTANLQAAIDWAHDNGYAQVILPEGEYLVGEEVNDIYQGGIDIYGNTEFIFSEGAIIGIETNDKWNYCVLSLNGDNIIIRDGTIVGERDTHIFTPRESDNSTSHDEGHGICMNNNNNVLIENMKIRDLTGDGSLVLESTDVTFTNNIIYNNRRQGISVVGGVRVSIKDN